MWTIRSYFDIFLWAIYFWTGLITPKCEAQTKKCCKSVWQRNAKRFRQTLGEKKEKQGIWTTTGREPKRKGHNNSFGIILLHNAASLVETMTDPCCGSILSHATDIWPFETNPLSCDIASVILHGTMNINLWSHFGSAAAAWCLFCRPSPGRERVCMGTTLDASTFAKTAVFASKQLQYPCGTLMLFHQWLSQTSSTVSNRWVHSRSSTCSELSLTFKEKDGSSNMERCTGVCHEMHSQHSSPDVCTMELSPKSTVVCFDPLKCLSCWRLNLRVSRTCQVPEKWRRKRNCELRIIYWTYQPTIAHTCDISL